MLHPDIHTCETYMHEPVFDGSFSFLVIRSLLLYPVPQPENPVTVPSSENRIAVISLDEMPSTSPPFVVRSLASGVLIICSAVVLGISAHVEKSVSRSRVACSLILTRVYEMRVSLSEDGPIGPPVRNENLDIHIRRLRRSLHPSRRGDLPHPPPGNSSVEGRKPYLRDGTRSPRLFPLARWVECQISIWS